MQAPEAALSETHCTTNWEVMIVEMPFWNQARIRQSLTHCKAGQSLRRRQELRGSWVRVLSPEDHVTTARLIESFTVFQACSSGFCTSRPLPNVKTATNATFLRHTSGRFLPESEPPIYHIPSHVSLCRRARSQDCTPGRQLWRPNADHDERDQGAFGFTPCVTLYQARVGDCSSRTPCVTSACRLGSLDQ